MSYALILLVTIIYNINFVQATYPACVTGLTCTTLTPRDKPDFAFDCAFIQSTLPTTKGQVYYMHGNDGKQSKAMFFNMMLRLAPLGYNGLSATLEARLEVIHQMLHLLNTLPIITMN
jgi:hypothetical protein